MIIRKITLSPRLIMFLSFASMSIVNYAFGLAAGWLLVPGDFGLLAFAQTVLTVCGLVLNSGFTWSLTVALVGVDGTRRAALVRGAVVANLLLALAMSLMILLLFAWGPLKPGLESWNIATLVALSLPFISLVATARGALQGTERFNALVLLLVSEVASKAISGVLLVMLGFGATGAVAGFVIGSAIGAMLGITLLRQAFGVHLIGPAKRPSLKISGELFGALLGTALLLNLDILALKLLSGTDRAVTGYYQAAIVLANTPYYLATAMLPILFTRIARLKALEQSYIAVGEAFKFAMLILFPIEVAFVFIPHTVLGLLFPEAYTAATSALRLLAFGNCAIILVAILSVAFQATGNARVPARILLVSVIGEAFALYAVVPIWHASGAASLFLAASVSALIVLGVSYLQNLNREIVQAILPWFLKYAIACAIGGIGMLVGLRTNPNGVLALGIGGVCFLLVGFALGLLRLPKQNLPWGQSNHELVREKL